jgi:hypothetical protein
VSLPGAVRVYIPPPPEPDQEAAVRAAAGPRVKDAAVQAELAAVRLDTSSYEVKTLYQKN